MNKKVLISGIILIVIGLGLALFGLIPKNTERQADIDNWTRLSEGAGLKAEGTVVDSERVTVTEGARRARSINAYYCPVFEFTVNDATQRTRAVGDDCKDNQEDVVKGATATILYDQADPTIAFVDSTATKEFYTTDGGTQVASLVVGGILVLIGVFVLIGGRPKTPEQQAAAEAKRRQAEEDLAKLMAAVDGEKKQQ